ncbi:GtrA family protein, partial [Acinetobacter baumannii]
MTASQKSRTTRELMRALRFGVIGLVGFLCDAAILAFMTHVVHTNALAGRAVSAPIAILLTFLGH